MIGRGLNLTERQALLAPLELGNVVERADTVQCLPGCEVATRDVVA